MSDAIRESVLSRASVREIEDAAFAEGMRMMREDGIQKVRDGVTTLAEVTRVTVS
jgi:type II secretory ATPase GspE/PulE/Tfp pilus assembly ATPase PilB-like protein